MSGKPDRRQHYRLEMGRRADELARKVLPNGRRRGSEWEGTGPDGIKWSINIGNGPRRGVFSIFSIGYSGDIVDFACRGLFNNEWLAFDEWAAGWTGWNGSRERPELLRDLEDQAKRAKLARQEQEAQEVQRRTGQARQIYNQAAADPQPAFTYLAGRGLPVPAELVPELRFGRDVPYDKDGEHGRLLPAMVAPVLGASDGRFLGVHRTYIQADAEAWRKIAEDSPRLSRGPIRGGIIPLIGHGAPWAAWLAARQAQAEPLLLAEGIENALSASAAFPGVRCCAFLSAGNLDAVAEHLPRHADPVILVMDRDEKSPGRRGILAQREAALTRWLEQGRQVIALAAPRLPGVKDLNDQLCQLTRCHGYTARFGTTPASIDWQAVLRNAVPVTAGDPVASWWESIVATPWDNTARLLLHPALPQIEAPDVATPAVLVPLHGEHGERIGVLVAWLVQRDDGWGLAPLMLPVRVVGSPDGIAIIRRAGKKGEARLVIGLENALVVAAWEKATVLCAVDPSHAVRCARGVPAGIEAIDLYTENEDETTAWRLLLQHTQRALTEFGIKRVRWQRPWPNHPDFAAMFRDEELGLIP